MTRPNLPVIIGVLFCVFAWCLLVKLFRGGL